MFSCIRRAQGTILANMCLSKINCTFVIARNEAITFMCGSSQGLQVFAMTQIMKAYPLIKNQIYEKSSVLVFERIQPTLQQQVN